MMSHQFSLDEIKYATKNFEKVLGQGGEAIVYLGEIPAFGKVAVKCLKSNLVEFEEEIDIVSKIKHPHLISLLGYCDEPGQKILVYEYMRKGSLYNYIKKDSKSNVCLSWLQRLYICLGAARGLQLLHTETDKLPKGIIHRDIKPANILLDDDWVAKISDFGMCKLSHASQTQSTMITGLKGTSGYYAPEYVKYGSITRKIDVYAFGVVLFEVLCQKMPWDRGGESYYRSEDEDLGLWARENVYPEIIEEISEDCLEVFTHIIERSLQLEPIKRPTMDDVVSDLECAIKHQESPDEGNRLKASTSSGKVSIPSSVQKMINDIKEMKITDNGEDDEIYAMLKESSMNPIQAIQKLLIKGRNSSNTTEELPDAMKKPVGILFVKVVRAGELEKLRSLGDQTYCVKVRLNDKPFQSKTTKLQLYFHSKGWKETFSMFVKDPNSQVVEFYLCDSEYDSVSKSSIPLKELTVNEHKKFKLDIFGNMGPNGVVNKKAIGELEVKLTYKSITEENMSAMIHALAQSNYYDEESSIVQAPIETPSGEGLLFVRVHAAKHLEGKHHTNPVVQISLGGEKRITKPVMNNRNPVWGEAFTFRLQELPIDGIMHVKVFSIPPKLRLLRPKEFLGCTDIKLSDVVQLKRFKESYHLRDSVSGKILIELEWARHNSPSACPDSYQHLQFWFGSQDEW